jgi:hypothetical protein
MPQRVLDGINQRYESKSDTKRTAKQKSRQLIRHPLVDHDESRDRQDRISDDFQWRRDISHICRPFGRRAQTGARNYQAPLFIFFLPAQIHRSARWPRLQTGG